MPAVFYYKGYRFFFYSNEGDPLEPLHIHVRRGEAVAKFWLSTQTRIAESYGLNSVELRELMQVAEENRERIEGTGMNTFTGEPLARSIRFDEDNLWVELADGRQVGIPLAYFPRLLNATPTQREHYLISGGGTGLHWDELDEDLSVKSLLLGIGDRSRPASTIER